MQGNVIEYGNPNDITPQEALGKAHRIGKAVTQAIGSSRDFIDQVSVRGYDVSVLHAHRWLTELPEGYTPHIDRYEIVER